MSSPTLNEDAIAALFAAAEDGSLPQESHGGDSRAGQPTVRTVDFRRPRQFTGEVQRRLRRSLDTFCRTASNRLSAELRTAVDLEVIGLDQLTWADAHGQLPSTSLTAVLAIEPSKTRMMLAAELGLVLGAIERMLGGTGDSPPPPRRLTDIDSMLAGEVFEVLVSQLSVMWSELVDATVSVAAVSGQQQTAQLAPTSEPTLTFTVEVKFLGSSTTLVLLVPFRAIAPFVDRLSAGDGLDPYAESLAADAMRSGVGTVEMEVRAEVGAVELPVADVLAISVGDLLRLDGNARSGVTLLVDHTPIGWGRPGRSGACRAVQTTTAAGVH